MDSYFTLIMYKKPNFPIWMTIPGLQNYVHKFHMYVCDYDRPSVKLLLFY